MNKEWLSSTLKNCLFSSFRGFNSDCNESIFNFSCKDVDGNEYHVIKGAQRFIRKHKPLILIEISKSLISKIQFESLIDVLEKCNYKIIMFKFFKFSPKILKFDPRNLGIDYFFIHKNYKKKI